MPVSLGFRAHDADTNRVKKVRQLLEFLLFSGKTRGTGMRPFAGPTQKRRARRALARGFVN